MRIQNHNCNPVLERGPAFEDFLNLVGRDAVDAVADADVGVLPEEQVAAPIGVGIDCIDQFHSREGIEAVDADANGRGDLLFRQYSDVGITYGLYRVSPYQIEKIFEGGSSL